MGETWVRFSVWTVARDVSMPSTAETGSNRRDSLIFHPSSTRTTMRYRFHRYFPHRQDGDPASRSEFGDADRWRRCPCVAPIDSDPAAISIFATHTRTSPPKIINVGFAPKSYLNGSRFSASGFSRVFARIPLDNHRPHPSPSRRAPGSTNSSLFHPPVC